MAITTMNFFAPNGMFSQSGSHIIILSILLKDYKTQYFYWRVNCFTDFIFHDAIEIVKLSFGQLAIVIAIFNRNCCIV